MAGSRPVLAALLGILAVAMCHPTMYKLNQKKQFEPDLIPVSSTVIPLPIYQVSSNLNIGTKEEKYSKPVGPISLITSANYKKSYPRPKVADPSSVKEVSNKEFHS